MNYAAAVSDSCVSSVFPHCKTTKDVQIRTFFAAKLLNLYVKGCESYMTWPSAHRNIVNGAKLNVDRM